MLEHSTRRPAHTPSRSPARKRQRLSPQFDEFPTPSQDELRGFDEIEANLFGTDDGSHLRHTSGSLNGDSDNPFIVTSKPASSFASASFHLNSADSDVRLSQSDPPEQSFKSWFAPLPSEAVNTGFQNVKSLVAPPAQSAFVGFQKASKGTFMPSEAALQKAREKMEEIWKDDSADQPAPIQAPQAPSSFSSAAAAFASADANTFAPTSSFFRPPLRALENSPATPTPRGPSPFVSPLAGKVAPKPFKSPHLTTTTARGNTPNPTTSQPPAPTRPQHPLAAEPITAVPASSAFRPLSSTGFSTPARSSASVRTTPARFVTPFKSGMRPGEPGRKGLDSVKLPSATKPWQTPIKPVKVIKPKPPAVFNLVPTKHRANLKESGLVPQQLTEDDFEDAGIDVQSLKQITPETALYYSFYCSPWLTPQPSDAPFSLDANTRLGTTQALTHMKNRGCTMATQPWVDNHWALILWKLAGMAFLDPSTEGSETLKRWSWREALTQLLYRYERELNQGIRPPLRKIATQDMPASCPMVLCVSNINTAIPELEVTDGWYRMRAQVDEPLARAIQKGTIRVGRKIAVAGCSLSSERKEPGEILEVYDSVALVLRGNGSHLAPWHAKLGFLNTCPIATMSSLTADGGIISSMDLVITQVYPKFFVEFKERDGRRVAEASRSEAEENRECDKWIRLREMEATKLQMELEKTYNRFQAYADRLDRKAGSNFRVTEAGPPDHIDGMYDDLEDPTDATDLLARISATDAGWLALHIRKVAERNRERSGEDVGRDLEAMVPPRVVVSARILVVKDSQTARRPSNRTAQLTVWDVNKLNLTDGKSEGYFEVGQRFQVTSLHPSNLSSWMSNKEHDAQIFLCTKGHTTWRKMKT